MMAGENERIPLSETVLGAAAQKWSEEVLQRNLEKFERVAAEEPASDHNQFVLDVIHNERGRRLLESLSFM